MVILSVPLIFKYITHIIMLNDFPHDLRPYQKKFKTNSNIVIILREKCRKKGREKVKEKETFRGCERVLMISVIDWNFLNFIITINNNNKIVEV